MCPECGSGDAHTLDVDRTATDHVVRLRQCKYCGTEYTTIEAYVPVSFYRLAIRRRDASLKSSRKRAGYKGQKTRPVVSPPDIVFSVRVREH